MAISGATRLAAVIGDPVRHSLSPALHNAAFEACGLDWVYVALAVPRGRAGEALMGAAALGIEGLSVTMPHKEAVADALTWLTPTAARLRAVNCVVRAEDGTFMGDSTDGGGFLDSLVCADVPVAGRRVVVLGAGGAARAVVAALGDAGAGSVIVVARRSEAAAEAAALATGRAGSQSDVTSADLVINATPVGMGENAGALPVDAGLLRPGQTVVDLVYEPRRTALLAAAEAVGAQAVDGLGMLVHQAARAFTAWTGVEAPVEAMRAAAERELALRAR
jgi:shikimate dehydrogenase